MGSSSSSSSSSSSDSSDDDDDSFDSLYVRKRSNVQRFESNRGIATLHTARIYGRIKDKCEERSALFTGLTLYELDMCNGELPHECFPEKPPCDSSSETVDGTSSWSSDSSSWCTSVSKSVDEEEDTKFASLSSTSTSESGSNDDDDDNDDGDDDDSSSSRVGPGRRRRLVELPEQRRIDRHSVQVAPPRREDPRGLFVELFVVVELLVELLVVVEQQQQRFERLCLLNFLEGSKTYFIS